MPNLKNLASRVRDRIMRKEKKLAEEPPESEQPGA